MERGMKSLDFKKVPSFLSDLKANEFVNWPQKSDYKQPKKQQL